MQEHITPARVANSIMQSTFSGIFLLVEGNSDYHFYKKFINKNKCEIKQTFGCFKLLDILSILLSNNFSRLLAIIDSDFRNLDNDIPNFPNLIMTDDHDIEMMIFNSPALERVIELYYSESRFISFLKKKGIDYRSLLLKLASPLAYLKWANKNYDLGLVFKSKSQDGNPIKYIKFIDEKTMEMKDAETMIKTIINYSNNKGTTIKPMPEIINKFKTQSAVNAHPLQLCNGHDITNLISLSLRKAIGNKNIDYKVIENSLIIAYDTSEFKQTNLYSLIRTWEKSKNLEILSDAFK